MSQYSPLPAPVVREEPVVGLLELPNEVLLEIIQYAAHSKPALVRLTLTNRLLRALTAPMLSGFWRCSKRTKLLKSGRALDKGTFYGAEHTSVANIGSFRRLGGNRTAKRSAKKGTENVATIHTLQNLPALRSLYFTPPPENLSTLKRVVENSTFTMATLELLEIDPKCSFLITHCPALKYLKSTWHTDLYNPPATEPMPTHDFVREAAKLPRLKLLSLNSWETLKLLIEIRNLAPRLETLYYTDWKSDEASHERSIMTEIRGLKNLKHYSVSRMLHEYCKCGRTGTNSQTQQSCIFRQLDVASRNQYGFSEP